MSAPSTRVPMVPIAAVATPLACSAPSASRTVVVLPCVPVTPTIRSDAAGSSYTKDAKRPSSTLGEATSRTGTPTGARSAPAASVNTATAPAATASAAKSMPWARLPGNAA